VFSGGIWSNGGGIENMCSIVTEACSSERLIAPVMLPLLPDDRLTAAHRVLLSCNLKGAF
jgi:hypothetical protein